MAVRQVLCKIRKLQINLPEMQIYNLPCITVGKNRIRTEFSLQIFLTGLYSSYLIYEAKRTPLYN